MEFGKSVDINFSVGDAELWNADTEATQSREGKMEDGQFFFFVMKKDSKNRRGQSTGVKCESLQKRCDASVEYREEVHEEVPRHIRAALENTVQKKKEMARDSWYEDEEKEKIQEQASAHRPEEKCESQRIW